MTDGAEKFLSRLVAFSYVGAIVLGAAWMVLSHEGSLFAS